MNLKDAIYNRRSTRVFQKKDVPNDVILKLIEAGIHAPSACNHQNWKFIVVRNGDRQLYANEILSNAPVIIFVAYKNDDKNVSGYKHKDYIQSAAAAIENIILMAENENIGACWVCDLPDNKELQDHFEVPTNYDIVAAIAIGYRTDNDNTYSQEIFHGIDKSYKRIKYGVNNCTYIEKFGKPLMNNTCPQDEFDGNENIVRQFWLTCMLTIAKPVLEACSNNQLHEKLPLESSNQCRAARYSHLEALARTVLGISPWLESNEYLSREEFNQKELYRDLTRKSILHSVDPSSKDFMNWADGDQPLVDAAFLALGILQAKTELWDKFSNEEQQMILTALKKTRLINPWRSNWILFSSMIEVFVYELEGEAHCIKSVIEYGVSQFEQWYVGDGFYKDGDNFHFDYYESIVIHPFLLEISRRIPWLDDAKYVNRARRYCKILNSFISDDGTYPAIGRSICYRGGIFHLLSRMVLLGYLNEDVNENLRVRENEVRTNLMSVLNRFMSNNIFDDNGWLVIGMTDYQPLLAEEYVNTGSLYMFLSMFLVLGTSTKSEFWCGDKSKSYSSKIWLGRDEVADMSLEGWKN